MTDIADLESRRANDPEGLFEMCSNWDRWGSDDELGTLNYVDSAKMLAALSLPTQGVAIGLGRELRVGGGEVDQEGQFASTTARAGEISVSDDWRMTIHGYGMTHLDALGHTLYQDRMYNGRHINDVFGSNGLSFGSVLAYGSGVITRGILLDVAAARQSGYLEIGEGVGVADLEAAEARAGVTVGRGDAILVRTGLAVRRARAGYDGDEVRTGVLPEVLPWIHGRQVAVYSGDCIERLPSGYASMSFPLHQVGQVSMGLCILDIPDVERLAEACQRFNRHEFLLIVAPLRVAGASGSPVNPIAVF